MMGSYDSQAKTMVKFAKNLEKRIERLDKVDQPRKETWVRMEAKGALDTGLHSLFRLQAGQVLLDEVYLFDFPQIGMTILNLLGMLGLSYDKAQQKVANLSGGERVRLSLAKVLLADANLLILDEPTNFLDMAAIEALETFLKEYEGSVLLISHDQQFVETSVHSQWEIVQACLVKKS
ncbi:ATP-binding cassette domain-containing protein [Streptococcus suis]|nr:ATP-binding cassette domain-containing protein [Streptococcus suis]